MANLLTHSRKKWREKGYYVEGTESIIKLPGGVTRRSDLFGFADLVAVPSDKDRPWIFLQVTSRSNTSARLRKIQNGTTGKGQWETPIREIARRVLDAGHRIVIEGWDQKKAYAPWRDKEVEVTHEHLEATE